MPLRAILRFLQEMSLYASEKYIEIEIQLPASIFTRLNIDLMETERYLKNRTTKLNDVIEVNDAYGKATIKIKDKKEKLDALLNP